MLVLFLSLLPCLGIFASVQAATEFHDGDVRLEGGTMEISISGRVEVYLNGTWGTVCDDYWLVSKNNARVVCRQLGYDGTVRALERATHGEGTGPIYYDEVMCTGSEESLDKCPHDGVGVHNCDHGEDAGVECTITITTTSTTSSLSPSISPSQSPSPSPTVEPMSQECVGVSQEAAGRQDTSTAAIAASALLAVLFLLALLISSVLVLWVVRLNKQLASVKGSISDQPIQLTNVHTVRNDLANNPVYIVPNQPTGDGVVYEVMASEDVHTVQSDLANNPVYNVPNQPTGDGVVYEVMASEDVHAAPVVTTFNSDHEGYSRLQRDSSVFTQSTTSTTGDGHVDVEAFYGSLDNAEQYINSAVQRSLPTSPYLLMSVPTKEQREWLASQGGTASNGDNPYAALDASTISDDRTYWSPGATEDEIYGQMSQNKYQELPRSSVHLREALGEGEFGDVYRGEWQSPMGCVEVAVKVSKDCLEPDERVKLLQEAAVMGQFLHPRVVRLFGVVTLGDPYMMVMECLANGNLLEHLLDLNERFPKDPDLPKKLLQYCLEIADGMSYLSKKGFIHRDLAARNILLDKRWRCKISDFGMSRDVCDNYYHVSGGRLPLCWTAPEAILYRKYTTKSDVWSYGMVMYEIWSLGHKPFEDFSVEEVIRAFASGFCLSPPPGCPRGVYLLMVECWNPEPIERPVFNKLMTAFLINPSLLLKWTAKDRIVSPQASKLGAPLEEGKGLYTNLQFKYKGKETD